MPSFKVHLLAGGVIYVALYQTLVHFNVHQSLSYQNQCLFLLATLIGSVFPDIDVRSRAQKGFFIAMFIVLPCLLFYNLTLFSIVCTACVLLLFSPHRTITHSLLFILLFPCISAALCAYYIQSITPKIAFSICTYFT